MNAAEAVKMARHYRRPLRTFSQSSWVEAAPNLPVLDNNPSGVTHSLKVTDSGKVESVQIKVSLTNEQLKTLQLDEERGVEVSTTIGSDTAIELTSPSGTKSILMTPRTGLFASYDWAVGAPEEKYMYKDMVLMSNAFYGERARGTWTIRVVDTNGQLIPSDDPAYAFDNNTVDSVLESWGITLYGQRFDNELKGEG